MSSRATILIGEIRDLCNQLLPGSFNVKINVRLFRKIPPSSCYIYLSFSYKSLPTLLQVASNFDDETKRHGATLAITHIDFLQANKERFLLHAVDDAVAR
jgi:hypothetical protein